MLTKIFQITPLTQLSNPPSPRSRAHKMNEATPLFSAIIPCYNYGDRISRAIDSVTFQAGNDCEIIVINDGSTDNSASILKDLYTRGENFSYFNKTNGGAASARNYGIDKCRGRYLIFLDADDEMAQGALDALREAIQQQPDIDVWAGAHSNIFPDGNETKASEPNFSQTGYLRLHDYINKKVSLVNGALASKRYIFDKIRYPEDLKNSEDIPVFAQSVALFKCQSLAANMVRINKHRDSLRHNLDFLIQGHLHVVDHTFREELFPKELMVLKRSYLSQRCLSLSRILIKAGQKQQGRAFFHQAVKARKSAILKWPYLKNYLRSFL